MADETAPSNVQAVLADGSVVPLEMTYSGLNEEGIHVWSSTSTLPFGTRSIRCDVMPAKTALSFTTVPLDSTVVDLLHPG